MNNVSRYARVALVALSAMTVASFLIYTFVGESGTLTSAYWPALKPSAQVKTQPSAPAEAVLATRPSEPLTRPSSIVNAAESSPTVAFEEKGDAGDMPFSKDIYTQVLSDPLPIVDFTRFKDLPPAHSDDTSGYTYATFLCNHDANLRHPYFAAVQSLVWRLLWSPWATKKYPMLVLVCPITPPIYRDILRGQGASVREVPFMDGPEIRFNIGRWQDMYSKLHLWNLTDFSKIVFMDVDAFPIENIDEVFDVPLQRCNTTRMNADDYQLYRDNPDEAANYCEYLFAGVEWPDFFLGRHELNAGFLVLKPNRLMFERLLGARFQTDKYALGHLEQGLLASNEVGFGDLSAFPMRKLSRAYNVGLGVYYDSDLMDRAKVLHEKLWNRAMMIHSERDHDTWDTDWMALARFYDSPAFETSRKLGFLRMDMQEQIYLFGDILRLDLLDERERQERIEHLKRLEQEARDKFDREAAEKASSQAPPATQPLSVQAETDQQEETDQQGQVKADVADNIPTSRLPKDPVDARVTDTEADAFA